jgi:hypothetical protein
MPGGAKKLTRKPWAELDEFFREDNILQLRSIMAAVAARGRRWVPGRAVIPGSFVELSDRDVKEVARKEHSRWYERRRKAGWRATADGEEDDDYARVNGHVRPWADLPRKMREGLAEYARTQVRQLEAVGFMPVLPDCGPAGATEHVRVGEVRAERLTASYTWRRAPSGDEMSGAIGDWRVIDVSGDERTVRDGEFQLTHQPLGGDRWRRIDHVRAWLVKDSVALRTLEGRATAQPGDWIIQGPGGMRWPVTNERFKRGYRPIPDGAQESAAAE